LLQQGINLVQDEVEDVNFTFEMSATPSLGELIEAISQVDRAIRVAAGIAACRNGQLGIGPRSYLRDLGALETWLQDDSEAWDLAIDKLELGSFLIKLRPKGESNKKIVKNPAATLALLASLSQITGVTAAGATQDVMGGKASHSIVQVSDVSINVPGPSDENIIVRLPSDSKLRETIDLGGGKSIVLEIQTESKGTVSS
jgi:hypothetical protein